MEKKQSKLSSILKNTHIKLKPPPQINIPSHIKLNLSSKHINKALLQEDNNKIKLMKKIKTQLSCKNLISKLRQKSQEKSRLFQEYKSLETEIEKSELQIKSIFQVAKKQLEKQGKLNLTQINKITQSPEKKVIIKKTTPNIKERRKNQIYDNKTFNFTSYSNKKSTSNSIHKSKKSSFQLSQPKFFIPKSLTKNESRSKSNKSQQQKILKKLDIKNKLLKHLSTQQSRKQSQQNKQVLFPKQSQPLIKKLQAKPQKSQAQLFLINKSYQLNSKKPSIQNKTFNLFKK